MARWLSMVSGLLPAGTAGDLEEGLRELAELIRDVGGERIGPPDVHGNRVYVPLTARDGERYILRIIVERYLAEPPRCTFVDEHYQETPAAWPSPDPRGPFRAPTFICTPPTAEFYRYHRDRAYDPGEGTLANTVATIFVALNDVSGYSGRYRSARRGPAR